MIFMDKEFWTKEVPIWPLLLDLMERQKYKNLLLTLSDSENEIVSTIMAFHEGAKEQEGKTED
jgi:hypothetical protein